jgi:uncharacterized protein
MSEVKSEDYSKTLAAPTSSGERNPIIDILRGFALFGILLVNFPGSEAARSGAVDDTVQKLLTIFVSGKFYTTFSFLFGLGFALQLLRAQKRGQRIVPVYIRRMLVLFLIGLGHSVLIWEGDVLLYYAFMGCFLIPFRNQSAKILIPAALLVMAGGYYLNTTEKPFFVRDLVPQLVSPELEQESALKQAVAYNEIGEAGRRLWAAIKSGTYLDVVAARFETWRLSNRYLFNYVWPMSFAMFLIGMFAGRHAVIRYPPTRSVLLRRVMWIALPVWLSLAVLLAYGPQLSSSFYFKIHWKVLSLIWMIQQPAGSLFYILAIVSLLASRPTWVSKLSPLGAVGRMALTNYLLQSVVGTTLYYGYGLNFQTRMGNLPGFLLAMVVFSFQILLSSSWLRRFQFGPAEWLWRSLTYLRFQPMKISRLSNSDR